MDDPSDAFALETAACLWEAVLNLRDNPTTHPESLAYEIRAAFDALGTAGMRMMVIGWTGTVDAAWEAVREGYDMSSTGISCPTGSSPMSTGRIRGIRRSALLRKGREWGLRAVMLPHRTRRFP